jgi:hypothetical protein
MTTTDRVGVAALVITVLSPALWYLTGSVLLTALVAVVGVGLLLGWLSARIHGRLADAAAGTKPPV